MAVIPLKESGDIKLYILCIMQSVGYPLEYSEINDLSLYEGVISNMDFIEAFDELQSSGLVDRDENGLYYVTEDGDFIEKTLKSDLSGYIHDRGLRAALQSIQFRESKVKKNIDLTEQEDGRVRAVMTLYKNGVEIMKIDLVFDTLYQAKKAAGAFSDDPVLVYTRLISLLGGS